MRITSEQLEYMIARIVGTGSGASKSRRRKTTSHTFIPPGVGLTQFLGVDETRVAFVVAAFAFPVQVTNNGSAVTNEGLGIPTGQTLTTPFTADLYGFSISQPWYVNTQSLGAGVSWLEVSEPGYWS